MAKRPMKRRQRGAILSMHGLSRWQEAVQAAEQSENEGQRFTLEALGNRIRIAPKTLRKVLRRQVSVDRSTLELCFSAFQLQLEAKDVDYLESPVALVANLPKSVQPPQPLTGQAIDWGEAPDHHPFYGREAELAQLTQWIQQDRCRSITLLGLGGIGKTALASHLAYQVAPTFAVVLWRSLRHAPDFATLLRDCVLFLSGNQSLTYTLPSLMEQLRKRRCLMVLDNFESVLEAGEHAGRYRSGYEPYGDLLRTIADAQHQSCLILTSREKPVETTWVPEERNKLLILKGSPAIAEGILIDRHLQGDEAQRQDLSQLYNHNPLALKVVAASIHELFDGNVALYLAQGFTVPKGVQWVLAEQFARLSELEKTISYWLAINRDWTSIDDLEADIFPVVQRSAILQALESLIWRSLIEHKGDRYTQQPVIMEYVLKQLLEYLWEELTGSRPLSPDASSTVDSKSQPWPMLSRYALVKTTVREYIRQRQKQWILKPLGDRLRQHLQTPTNVEHQLKTVLEQLKAVEQPTQQGYGTGNCIKLLQVAGIDLAGYDFSQRPIWQISLQTLSLRRTNFTNAHFQQARFARAFGIILSLDFSLDGAFLAASDSLGTIRVYRVSTAQLHCLCQGHTSRVMAVRWSPDGTRLASASMDHTVRLWNAQTGVTDTLLTGHTNIVMSVSWHPTKPLLATGSDDYTVRLWNTETGNLHQVWEGHTDSVWSVDWSPNGTWLASASVDKTVRLWHLDTDKCQILQGHTDSLWAVEWCPDGQTLVSAGEDQTIRIWDAATGTTRRILNGHQSWIWALRVSPDGRQLASGSRDRTLRLWDLSTGQPLKLLQSHTDGVSAICWHPQGHLLVSGGTDQTIRLWDSQSGYALMSFQGQVPTVWSLDWQPTQSLPSQSTAPVLASGHDGHICLWEGNTGRLKHQLQGHQLRVWQIAWSPDGRQLASCGDDGTIRLWKGETGQPLQVWSGHQGQRIWSVAWHPNETLLASGGADAAIWLWDTVTEQCLKVWNAHQRDITTVQFSPDGQWLAVGGDGGGVQLWSVATGEPLAVWEGHGDRITQLQFSPDGHLLASASEDRTIRLWQVPSGHCDRILSGHENRVWSIDFSSDGYTLASGSTDRTVRLWNLASGECEAVLDQHNSLIWAVRWRPDGQTLATAGEDGCVNIWGLPGFTHLKTLTSDRLYEGMNLSGVTGLSRATLISLKQLGAIEQE